MAGMASVRLIWPNWPACETFRPRLPDCGMSNIFIRYLLSFFCCLLLKRRAWPARPAKLRAPKVLPGVQEARRFSRLLPKDSGIGLARTLCPDLVR